VYIKISRDLGKVPATDGHGWCHYRVVIKFLCHRLCPLIFLRKLSSIFPHVMMSAAISEDRFIGPYFFDTSVSHIDYYWNMRQSWDFPTSACEKIRSNGCPLTRQCTIILCYHFTEQLDDKFSVRWIGRGSDMVRPSSTDMICWKCHFYLLTHFKFLSTKALM